MLLQQRFQLPGSWQGLCRLGHHSFAATTQDAALSTADLTQMIYPLDVWGSIAVHSDITTPHDFSILRSWVLDFKWQRFNFLRCWALLIVAAIWAAEASN